MAKKENINKGEEAKKTTKTGKSTPKQSGDVKGPMGVGGEKKPKDKAVEKEPSKINQPAKGRFSENKKRTEASDEKSSKAKSSENEDDVKKLPKPKKKLPAKTAASQDKSDKTSMAKKPAKFKTRVYDKEQKRDYLDLENEKEEKSGVAKETSGTSAKKVVPKKTTSASDKTGTPSAKPKATKKSAKEKSPVADKNASEVKKAKNTRKTTAGKSKAKATSEEKTLSPSELKDEAFKTAKNLADNFLPDEETQKQIKDTAKAILPDKEELMEKAAKTAKNFIPDPETTEKAKEKAKKAASKAAEKAQEKKEKAKEAAANTAQKAKEKKEKAKETAKEAADFSKSKKTSPAKETENDNRISDYDVHLFREGKHFHLYKKLGSHPMEFLGTKGVYFAVWAPNASEVSVIGDFNEWDKNAHRMKPREDNSGIWEIFIPEAKKGSLYKYFIRSQNGYEAEKGDPFAFMWETPPETASLVWDLDTEWKDSAWMKSRKAEAENPKPMSVYEIHLGSWRRVPEEDNRSLSYRELAEQLPAYIKEMGFTHVEFMPVMEHPFFGSWGYQITGYFAPSSRFGTPQDFMALIEALHNSGIGVILDWVPSHFPSDLHGLHYFDGTHLFEHEDKRKGFHPDWQSYIFNYGRNEVRSFLISNALFWLDKFHVDGLRVDAVASMLYLDYSRKEGEWIPNEEGGNENFEAIGFLKEFNETVYKEFPDVVTIAEESTAWPMVSKPTYMGGLGFGQKWMMGWMHDTLEYFKNDPIHRKHHQNMITFSTTYAFTENFMLPLSHDEVVYGKGSILNKMPGDEWNKYANLRSLYSYMFAHPGTKLLFMGAEFGQETEWGHDNSLDWHLTHDLKHAQVQETLKALNKVYTSEPAFYEKAFESSGFEWVDINDAENSVISFLRKGKNEQDTVLVVCNLTPVPRENYRIGVPAAGKWKEIFNSDAEEFGGSNVRNNQLTSEAVGTHGKDNSVSLTLPPMGVVYFKRS